MINKKIVLSGDHQLQTILENSFFQREGFELVTVDENSSALQTVEIEAPALAILSLEVMGDQAMQSCRDIKADPLLDKTGVIMVLPNSADDLVADRCWESGCDAVVHPPLSANRLLNASCKLLQISQRLARRLPVRFALSFTAGTDQKSHPATAINMNTGGMFLATDKLFPIDTDLQLELSLPDFPTTIRIEGRVAWVNHPEWLKKDSLPSGMGIQFANLGENVLEVIREFLTAGRPKDA